MCECIHTLCVSIYMYTCTMYMHVHVEHVCRVHVHCTCINTIYMYMYMYIQGRYTVHHTSDFMKTVWGHWLFLSLIS